ncbi:monofunctional biosynthetic peptidoglycan transglycosylase [Chryseosolibacter indicus]|uniref:Biosynthetic peptidoglycan transglycosylase n=1 Tax=Chryseosolibacter indicus TaxID=2782351 RepID=A0ABS5VWW3_9BACT|nr:monofunctional biosynthetic peptidoglycan transglycosylase [Chryseosolibacter indicus]MBT1705374.1 monofunctional biosynthetic peptidoglycan transglycosylase [Chryseosolibacter indicus]
MSILQRSWQLIKRVVLILFIAQLIYIIVLKWVFPPVTVIQLGSWISGHGLKRDYVSFSEISPNAGLAVMAAEDQLFPVHNGFDWKSIEKALKHNEKKPTKIRGASTISQQVAKNVFLWNGRSWFRKGLEVYFTFMIELVWGKKRILEVYLNVSEMGKGVFGIEAASKAYFKKSAKKLTRTEAAKIAACLPNPKKYTVKPVSKAVQRRYPWVEQQMRNIGPDKDIQALLSTEKTKPV